MHRLLVADRAAENGPISVMGVIMEYYSHVRAEVPEGTYAGRSAMLDGVCAVSAVQLS